VGVARGVGPKEWVWGVAGAALLIVVQMTARAHTLTEQDAINLVNGLEDFNPALHQPHPPGYLLVVLAGHALSWLGNSLDALLGVALVASVIALIATYLLGRAMFGRSAGLVAATLLAATPLFLYYLNIASVYPTETAAAPIIGLIGYRVATRASDAWALALLPVLAVAGGFRPTVIALMLPLCAVAVWLGRPRPRPVLLGAAAAVAIVIAWAIPTISQSGGWDMYSEESSGLYGRAAGHTSLFYGASRLEAITNVEWSLGALLMVSVPAFVLLSLLAATNRSLPTPPRNLPAWSILAAWALPYIAFNALVLFGKPGYVMAIVPAIHVAAGGLARSYRRPQAAAIAVLAAMLLVFYTVPNLSLPRRLPAFFPTANSIDVADVEARGSATRRADMPTTQVHAVQPAAVRSVVGARPARHRHGVRTGFDDSSNLRLRGRGHFAEERDPVGRRAGAGSGQAKRRAGGNVRPVVGVSLAAAPDRADSEGRRQRRRPVRRRATSSANCPDEP
jgi:hypothetical protein